MEKQALKKLRHIALLGGLAAIVGGFFYDVLFAGIPYPDPTPALQHRYDFHSAVAAFIETAGVFMVLSGCIIWIAGCICRRKCKPAVQTNAEDGAVQHTGRDK